MPVDEITPRRRRPGPLPLVPLMIAACLLGAGPDWSDAQAVPPPRPARIEDFAPPESFVMAGSVKTHFVMKGETGPAVVLVHGFGASTFTWTRTLDALASRHRAFAVDLKGFGLTAKPKDGAYHPAAFAEHLVGFLDAMEIDKAVLVGHSMGGSVVTRVALERPERVLGLVLVAAAPAGWGVGKDMEEAIVGPNAGVPTAEGGEKTGGPIPGALPALAFRFLPTLLRAAMTPERVEAGLKGAFHDPSFVTPEMVEIYHRPITIEGAAEALASMLNPPASAVGKALPPLGSFKGPALIVTGAFDRAIPPAVADQYAEAWPQARRARFENSGHVVHEEEAEGFNALLLSFLRQFEHTPKAPRTDEPNQ